MKHRVIAVVIAAVALLGACSSDSEVGDESALQFDQEQADQFGATTSTTEAGATETTVPTETTEPAAETTVPPAQQEVTIEVTINDQSPYFDPALVQVLVGSKVRFTNKGSAEHSVTSDTGAFDSGPIAPGAAWIYVATGTGRFNYSDAARPFAVGTIEVS